ncbi:hypothetical protein SGRIM128S_00671 [Streptomyces griseomycini]
MTSNFSAMAVRRDFMTASMFFALALRSSSFIVSMAPSAPAQATGLPP